MSKLGKVDGRPRLRYRITFPTGSWADRSRRYRTMALARAKWPLAQELEDKTRFSEYTNSDIEKWRKARFLSESDIKRLGLNPGTKTLGQAMEDWKRSWDVSPDEAIVRRARIRQTLEILGENTPVKLLAYSDGLRLREELRSQGKKVKTVRNYIGDLKQIMRIQAANRAIPFNPFADLSAGKIPIKEKIAPRVLTPREISMVLERARTSPLFGGNFHLFLLMAYGCGLRRKELMLAKWEYIDWEERTLDLPESITKTKKKRRVGLGRRLYYELLVRRKNEGFIFPRMSRNHVSTSVTKHLKDCGIKGRLHDARHTYTTMVQGVGAKTDQAMQRTGHSDPRRLAQYTHPAMGRIFEDEFEFMRMPEGEEAGA